MVDYNGMCDTVRLNTLAAVPAIKVKPTVVVDGENDPARPAHLWVL